MGPLCQASVSGACATTSSLVVTSFMSFHVLPSRYGPEEAVGGANEVGKSRESLLRSHATAFLPDPLLPCILSPFLLLYPPFLSLFCFFSSSGVLSLISSSLLLSPPSIIPLISLIFSALLFYLVLLFFSPDLSLLFLL